MPHGGPHSCYPTSFFTGYAFLVTVGFNVLLVNFRGSTGFGEDSIQSLPGNIGTNDVLDCMACLQAAADTGELGKTTPRSGTLHLTFLGACGAPVCKAGHCYCTKSNTKCACTCLPCTY